jgi:hypothetical protein
MILVGPFVRENPDENSRTDPSASIDLKSFASSLKDRISNSRQSFQIVDQGSANIGGREVYNVLTTSQSPDFPIKELFMFTSANNTLYVFQLQSNDQAYSEVSPIVQQMILSAELTGANPDALEGDINLDREAEDQSLGGLGEGGQTRPFG